MIVPLPPLPGIEVGYVVYKWRNYFNGFLFDISPSGFTNRRQFTPTGINYYGGIVIPMDPITAIHLGLVTAEELGMPNSDFVQAALHIIGGPSRG